MAFADSDSLEEEIEAFREEVMPAFALGLSALQGRLGDFRIGVIDACPLPANLHSLGDDGDCELEGEQAWIHGSSPDLLEEFECTTDLYTDDVECSDEEEGQPVGSVLAALEPPGIPDENVQFLRSDGVLVVFAVTDEDERLPGATLSTPQLEQRLTALKPTAGSSVVFVGVGGSNACEGPYGSAEPASLLFDLATLFGNRDRGAFWDLCQGDLRSRVAEALTIVRAACSEAVELSAAREVP